MTRGARKLSKASVSCTLAGVEAHLRVCHPAELGPWLALRGPR